MLAFLLNTAVKMALNYLDFNEHPEKRLPNLMAAQAM